MLKANKIISTPVLILYKQLYFEIYFLHIFFGKFGFRLWFVLQKHTVGYYFGGLFLQNFQWWSRTNCKKVRKTNLLKTRNFPLDIFRSSGVFYDNQLTKLIWRLEFYGSSSWKFWMPMKTQKKNTRVCSGFVQQSPKNRKILLIFSFVHRFSTNYIQINLIA